MFRTVPLSIIRSFSLYTQQWYMSYRFADRLRAGSGEEEEEGVDQPALPGWRQPIRCAKDVTVIIGNTVPINSGCHVREDFSENYPQFGRFLRNVHQTCPRPKKFAGALNYQPSRFTNMFLAGRICPYLDMIPVPSSRYSD